MFISQITNLYLYTLLALLNKLGALVAKKENEAQGPLWLWPRTNPAKFQVKSSKLKPTSPRTTGTEVIPVPSYTEKGKALASLGP